MGTTGVASSIASQPWPRRIALNRHYCANSSQTFLPYCRKLRMGLDPPPRLSFSVNHKTPGIRIKRFGFGGFGSRFRDSEKVGLGLARSRTGRVRAQKDEQEKPEKPEKPELVKTEDKPIGSWASSFQRANTAARISMAAFVWISLFFGICITNSETGGARAGRRGPRK